MKRTLLAAMAAVAVATPALVLVSTAGSASAVLPSAAAPAPAPAEVSSGKVVNQRTGRPVQGVRVIVYDPQYERVLGRDRTNENGRWRIGGLTGLDDAEIGLKFNGDPVGYETGFYGVNPDRGLRQEVVRAIDRASASATDIGRILIERD